MDSNEVFREMAKRITLYYAVTTKKGIAKGAIAKKAGIPAGVYSELLSGARTASDNYINKLRIAFQKELDESLVPKIAPMIKILINHVVFLECEVFSSSAKNAIQAIENSTNELAKNLEEIDFFDLDGVNQSNEA